ncbi:AraC family transcriptional regulator [Paenibacillus sp. FSL K6-1230]|uniref:AraC family transcriptional regulator n=1 Tax=Paenibacillus sp. FSL K6-1230 TaxID=2921603 RepID=UPI0030F9EA69
MSYSSSKDAVSDRTSLDGVYLYIPANIFNIQQLSCEQVIPARPGTHRIILFRAPHGVLQLRKHLIQADYNQAYLLAPEAHASIRFAPFSNSDVNSPGLESAAPELGAVIIEFYVFQPGISQPAIEIHSSLSYETRIDIADEAKLLQLLDLLYESLHDQSEISEVSKLKEQIHMQELIVLLMENRERNQTVSDSIQAVEQTIAYIDQHYYETITAQQLYRIAGVAKWQYSMLFQTLTGKKPLDYLAETRIRHAKQLLLQTNDTLSHIAQSVGFRDESYFIRKFRQIEGVTPRQYVASTSRQLFVKSSAITEYNRVVAVGYSLGDMLSLGVQPIGADTDIIGKRAIYKDQLSGVQDIGLLGEPSKIRKLQPDLIVHSGFRQEWIDELALIAPTVLINRYEPVYQRIMKVAELFQKKEQAKRWVQFHQVACQEMWHEAARYMDVGQTATVFSMVEGSLYVMGMKGFSLTVYHTGGLRPSTKVQELINDGIPFRLTDIAYSQIYEADIYFLLTDNHPLTRQQYHQMLQSDYWRTLQRERMFYSENKWNFDDPITMDKLLLEMPQLLRRSKDKKYSH